MNESALEGFVKIVELNSFSAAAEALYLSQSALSQQIRTLEGQLQFELFQHIPRRVVLTPAGQDFYPKAKQLVALYQQAVRHARAVQQQENPPERHLLIAWSHEAMRMFGYDLFSLTDALCLQYSSIMTQCAMPVRYSSRKTRRKGIWSLHGAMRRCGCSGTTCFL